MGKILITVMTVLLGYLIINEYGTNKPVWSFISAVRTGKVRHYKQCFPPKVLTKLQGGNATAGYVQAFDQMMQWLPMQFGENYYIWSKIIDKEPGNIEELQSLYDQSGINLKIRKAYAVKLRMSIEGWHQYMSEVTTFFIIKEKGRWYIDIFSFAATYDMKELQTLW